MLATGRRITGLRQAFASVVIEAKTYGFFARKAGVPLPVAGARLVRDALLRRVGPGTCCLVPVPGTDFQLLARLATLEGRRLASFGVLDVELALLRRLLSPGDTFVDAGANVGVYSLAAAAAVGPTGRVIACEPAPGTMRLLRQSVALNEAWWVELHETALSDYHGTAEFVTFEPGSALSSFAPKRRTAGTTITVPVTSIDELVAGRVDDVALVKIDAEGAELQVVRGAQHLFATRRPPVIVELEPEHLRRQGASVGEFTDFFTRLGYSAYGITASGAVGQSIPPPWTRPQTGEPNVFLTAVGR